MHQPTSREDYDALLNHYPDMVKLAGTVTDVLNHMSNDTASGQLAFCLALENQHRTLQQAFTRLCVAWFTYAADPAYRTDPRNEGTHTLALALQSAMENAALPFI